MPSLFADVLICLRFFSRLPLPATRREAELGAGGLAAAVAMVPLAGALIGCVPALVLAGAGALRLPAPVAALLALAALLLVTGALHEDGLADCADGFGGGATRERKLAIMRDSRIGTFGACAIGLSLGLRGTSLALLAAHDGRQAAAILVAGAALSRTLCLLPLVLLPSARPAGMAASVGGLSPRRFGTAAALALVLAALPLVAGAGYLRLAAAIVAAAAAAGATIAVAHRQIGGHTGDVAGAAQQASEIALLVAFTADL